MTDERLEYLLERIREHDAYRVSAYGDPPEPDAMYQARQDAISAGNWEEFIFLCPKPFRVEAVVMLGDRLSDTDYWESAGMAWMMSESLWRDRYLLASLLENDRPGRLGMMDSDERESFEQLPNPVTVFRGYLPRRNLRGWSWTLDREKAEWFGRRFSSIFGGRVAEGRVPSSDVIAYLNGRKEREIVVNPKRVRVIRRWDVCDLP